MRVLISWLRELVDLPTDVNEIARRLTLAGLEVEGIERLDAGLANVVVGEVRSREPVPETKLSVCRVFDGERDRQIVCGARNYGPGDHVPLAKPGAVLPGGKVIGATRLRGIDSAGMLCSPKELGLEDDVDGLLILPRDTVPGTPIAQVIGRDDTAFELNVTPNRADALSHLGVARELSALFQAAMREPAPKLPPAEGPAPASVASADPARCSRFAARVLEGVKVGPSPMWLRRRLEALGQRSISNVVDATNLVLMELGTPLHAYDADLVRGATLVARLAREGETLRTLDGKDRPLSTDDLVIADAEHPLGLAGVMGGEESEVRPSTTRLLLESAVFSPESVRRSARRHGIHSEASHRFERGIDPERTRLALDRLTELLLEVAGGRPVGAALDVIARPHTRAHITLRHARIEGLLGAKVPWEEAMSVLRRLGLGVTETGPGVVSVEAPGARLDLTTETDLIEEVARVRGFDLIPSKIPDGRGTDAADSLPAAAIHRLRGALSAGGFDEAMNFAFVDPASLARIRPDFAPILVRNPLASDQAAMRTTLLGGLLENLGHNLRRGVGTVRLYELGRVYEALTQPPEGREGSATFVIDAEPRRLAFVAVGPRQLGWTGNKDAYDFYDLKGAVEQVLESLGIRGSTVGRATGVAFLHPRSAAEAFVGGRSVGVFGEIHPGLADALELPHGVVVAELDLEALLAHTRLVPRFESLTHFPAGLRDLAIVVEDRVTAAEVLAEIRAKDPQGLVEEARIFDVYKGAPLPEGKKNLAYSLTYRAKDRTLTDDEVNALHAAIVARLHSAFGAALRA